MLGLSLTSLAQLALVGGTLSYAFAGVWARIRLAGLHPVIVAAGMLTASSLTSLPAAWIIKGLVTLTLQTDTWIAITYYAGAATAGPNLLCYRVLALAGKPHAGDADDPTCGDHAGRLGTERGFDRERFCRVCNDCP